MSTNNPYDERDICTGVANDSIHQLNKLDKSLGNRKRRRIYPLTYIQAVFDAKSGTRLDAILDMVNSIYLPWKGTARATRIQVPFKVRRKGLMISYRNIDNEIITEKCITDECVKDDIFGLDSSWVLITDALPISGNVTIGSNGNWFVDGEDTGFKAQGPKGENGVPLQPRLSEDKTKIEYSLDGEVWQELFPLDLVTPTIEFSEPVGLEPGSTPTVTNIGDDFNVNLQLGLPKAPSVSVGSTTTIGEGNQAKVTNSGTPYAPVLNFHIPKGDTGRGITILGFQDTFELLKQNITEPEIGDVYCVGTTDPYHAYVWTNIYNAETQETTQDWKDLGEINKDTTVIVNDLGDREDVAMSQKGVSDKIINILKLNSNFLESATYPNIIQNDKTITIGNHMYIFIGNPLIYINMPSKTIDLESPLNGLRNVVLLEIDLYKYSSDTSVSETYCRYISISGSLTSLDTNKYYLPLFYYDEYFNIYYLNKAVKDLSNLNDLYNNKVHKIGNLSLFNASIYIPTKDIIVSEKYIDDEGFEKVNITIPDVFSNATILDVYSGSYNINGTKDIAGEYSVPYNYGMIALCCTSSIYKVEVFNLGQQYEDSLFIGNKYPNFYGYSITPLIFLYKGEIIYNAFLNINKYYESDFNIVNKTLNNLVEEKEISITFNQGCVLAGVVDFEVNSSENWVYSVIPIENVTRIKTYAGGKNNNLGLYAIHFMKNEEVIPDNYISSYSSSIPSSQNSVTLNDFYLNNIEIPQDAKYIIINCFASNKNEMGVYYTIYASSYVNNKLKDIEDKLEITNYNTFIVRKNPNSGEYGTIKEAIDHAKEYDSIIIYEGVYEEKHLNIPQGLKMEGIGKVEIRGKYPESTDVNTVTANSTLECNKGATLKNLIVTAQNMRYPIHADFSYGSKANWDIRNCKFIHYGNKEVYDYMTSQGQETEGTLVTGCSAWGGGTYGGDVVYCEDCYFESVGRAFSTHNNIGDTYINIGPSKVKLVNCELISKGIDIDGTQVGLLAPLFVQSLDCPVECEVILSNCKINGYIVRQNSGGDGWSNNIKLYSCGNQKVAFSSYGSGQIPLKNGDQTLKYQSSYDKYNIDDSINSYINIGDEEITKGKAVKRTSYGVSLLKEGDSEAIFGIALDNIPVNECGNIKESKGYIHRIYLDGLRTTDLSEGTNIYLTSNGSFSETGSVIVLKAVDNQNCMFL